MQGWLHQYTPTNYPLTHIYKRITVRPHSYNISTALWSALFVGFTLMSVADVYFDGVVSANHYGDCCVVDTSKLTLGSVYLNIASSISLLGTLISTCLSFRRYQRQARVLPRALSVVAIVTVVCMYLYAIAFLSSNRLISQSAT